MREAWRGFLSAPTELGSDDPSRAHGPAETSVPSVWRWATVEDTAPLTIRFDGDTTTLPLVPESLIDPATLTVGDRAWVQLYGRRVIVHGRAY